MKNIKKGRCVHNMNYETIIDLDNVTIQDCMDMYNMKNMYVVIDNGKVVNFEKEQI